MDILSPSFFVVRSPLLPTSTFVHLNEERICVLMEDPYVREAIQYASPSFLATWDREKIKTPRSIKTAFKYLSRMSGRCIPYGMFATLGMGRFSQKTDLYPPDRKELIRVHQKAGQEVDREFLTKFSDSEILKQSRFFKNPTLKFVTKNQITFYVWEEHSEVRQYRTSHLEIPKSVALFLNHFSHKFMFKDGLKFLKGLGGSKQECEEMLMHLIHEKLLLPEFHPSALEEIKTTVEASEKSTFTYYQSTPHISHEDLAKVINGVQILERCFKFRSHLAIRDEFDFLIENFKLRYDTSFVPLKDFITQYPLYPRPRVRRFEGELERFWANKLIRDIAKTPEGWRLSLEESDLNELQRLDEKYAQRSYSLPSSFSVMCSIGQKSVHIKNVYGASGQILLGRFTHGWEELTQELKKFSLMEEKESDDTIFAELDHYLGAKGVNVSTRNTSHRFRIPLIAGGKSGQEIELDDLYLGLHEDKFVLFSKKLQKKVSPRLNIAHNYKNNEMIYYSFLSSLARQTSFRNLYVHLGELGKVEHFPRISYKDIIFIPESWNMSGKVLQEIIQNRKEKEHGIPRFIQLREGDKNLPFDLDSPLARKILMSELGKLKEVRLEEIIHLTTEGDFAHEVVIPLINKESESTKTEIQLFSQKERLISPAGNCLYFKLYFTSRLDIIVIENLSKFLQQNQIANWFYIHYGDKDYHIRLRFFSLSKSEKEKILKLMINLTKDWLQEGLIWDFRLEPYRPELDSYGGPEGVRVFHQLSHLDSMKAIDFIRNRHTGELYETYLFLVKESLEYLRLIFPDLKERTAFISEYSSEVPAWEKDMLTSIIDEEGKAFLSAKSVLQKTNFDATCDVTRKKWIKKFHHQRQLGLISITPERLYSRMVHLLANRTSLKLFPFHEKRIQILVKNMVLREKHSR